MQEVDVDVVTSEPLQALPAGVVNLVAAKPAAAAGHSLAGRDLRGDQELAGKLRERCADHLLVVCLEVVLRGVQPVDPELDRGLDHADGARDVRLLVRLGAKLVAAETDP